MAGLGAEYNRRRRHAAADRGRCSTCVTNWAREGMRTCVECAAKDKRTHVAQAYYHSCCQSTHEHRFDCADVAREKRGPGPCLPTAPPTVAELISAMRRAG